MTDTGWSSLGQQQKTSCLLLLTLMPNERPVERAKFTNIGITKDDRLSVQNKLWRQKIGYT